MTRWNAPDIDPFALGWEARHARRPRHACPYARGTAKRALWDQGWLARDAEDLAIELEER